MIPKRIYFYWGNESISWMRYLTLYSFRKFNPDWQMSLHIARHAKDKKKWTTKELQDSFNFTGTDYMSKVKKIPDLEIKNEDMKLASVSPAQASDVFSWKMLSTTAGVYADMDILFIRPMTECYENIKNATSVVCLVRPEVFGIGFMASSGSNRLFDTAHRMSRRMYNPLRYESAGNSVLHAMTMRGGPSALGRRFHGTHFLDPMFVYRWNNKQIGEIFENNYSSIPEPTVGIHWFAGHPLAQHFNNVLTHVNYKEHKNTFTTMVEKMENM